MPTEADLKQFKWLHAAALIEGGTLLLLLGVAVPLKHLAGYGAAVSLMGPLHGMAFLFYIWMIANTVAGARWSKCDCARLLAGALLPFGAWFNAGFVRRKMAAPA